jgi:hypothetical protein
MGRVEEARGVRPPPGPIPKALGPFLRSSSDHGKSAAGVLDPVGVSVLHYATSSKTTSVMPADRSS